MNDTEKYYMIRAMRKWGGSFVIALADCFECADLLNKNRLLDAFPEYVKQYIELGKRMEREEKQNTPE